MPSKSETRVLSVDRYSGITLKKKYPECVTTPYVTENIDSRDHEYGFDVTTGNGYDDWLTRIAQGKQAGTTMSVSTNVYKPGSYECHGYVAYSGSRYRRYHSSCGSFIPSSWYNNLATVASESSSEANSKALGYFVNNARRAQRHVEGGVIAGEFIKTLRLIRNPLRSFDFLLGRYIRDVKKRANLAKRGKKFKSRRSRARRNKDVARAVADTWLEHSYGWAPLLADVDDISRYLARLTADEPTREFVVGIGKTETDSMQEYWQTGNSAVSLRWNKYAKITNTVVYKGLVRSDQSSNTWKHRDLGFAMNNFLPTVWELIPYSFLVDYFVNIDDLISNASFSKANFSWIMRWVIIESERGLINPRQHGDSGPLGLDYAIGTPASVLNKTISRSPYYGSLIPDFRFQIPGLSMKWLNISALVAGKSL